MAHSHKVHSCNDWHMWEAALGLLPFAAPVHPCTMAAVLPTLKKGQSPFFLKVL
jgi:hypothetical protein